MNVSKRSDESIEQTRPDIRCFCGGRKKRDNAALCSAFCYVKDKERESLSWDLQQVIVVAKASQMALMCSGFVKNWFPNQGGIMSGHKSGDTSRTLLPGRHCFGCVYRGRGLKRNFPHSRTDIRKTCLKKASGLDVWKRRVENIQRGGGELRAKWTTSRGNTREMS